VGAWPEPKEGSIFFEDRETYACLAFEPRVPGHTIVAWRADVEDLNDLTPAGFSHLVHVVYRVRNVLLGEFETDNVYVFYLNEAKHVHFHLLPRMPGGEKGPGLLSRPAGELTEHDLRVVVPRLRAATRRG
jgi:diadenosine tetraphosphate (Ap4A) HIT family hydrolase